MKNQFFQAFFFLQGSCLFAMGGADFSSPTSVALVSPPRVSSGHTANQVNNKPTMRIVQVVASGWLARTSSVVRWKETFPQPQQVWWLLGGSSQDLQVGSNPPPPLISHEYHEWPLGRGNNPQVWTKTITLVANYLRTGMILREITTHPKKYE